MKDAEKLRVLIPHWIEHNQGHEAECMKWSAVARKEGLQKAADSIDAAVKIMAQANALLEKALQEVGGAVEHDHHHDDHDHHHHHHHE